MKNYLSGALYEAKTTLSIYLPALTGNWDLKSLKSALAVTRLYDLFIVALYGMKSLKNRIQQRKFWDSILKWKWMEK